MDFRSTQRRDLLALLLSMSAVACSEPRDDTADATTDPPSVVAADSPAAAAQAQCEFESGFRISTDSIGPLGLADPIRVVRELCPQARSRPAPVGLPSLRGGVEGIVIPVPGGEVYGWQRSGDVLDLESKAHLWMVVGDGTLPEGMSMKSSVGDLKRAYGPGCPGFTEPEQNGFPGYVAVRFERQIGLTVYLENLDPRELEFPNRFEPFFDLSSVPDSATIVRVDVFTGAVSPERWCL